MKWILLLLFIVSCGNAGDGPALTDGVLPYEHRIFVTKGTSAGNFGALTNADALCQNEANAAGLTRQYKAIVSNGSTSAKERLAIYGAVYNLDSNDNQIKIVDTADDLWKAFTKPFLSPVELDAEGAPVIGKTWSGSLSEGSYASEHCSNWSNLSSNGQAGVIGSTRGDWLEDVTSDSCSQSFHFYCISQ